MNRLLDPTSDRLRQTMHAVADQVADAPPHFPPVPTTPVPSPRRSRALVAAAACLAALAIGAVTVVLTRDSGDGHTPVVQQPSIPSTAPVTTQPQLQHLVPGAAGTITKVAIQGDAENPQPLEYQVGYAGTVDGQAAQLLITADDFSRTNAPNFTLRNHGCSADGSKSIQLPGTIVPVGNHQACLVTNVQNALHIGWIDTDGVSVLLWASGLSVEQLETLAANVERVAGDPLALRLNAAPPNGLTLVGEGRRPIGNSTALEFEQNGCPYVLLTQLAAPVPFVFDSSSPPTTVRGTPGRIGGPATVLWTSDGSAMTLGIRTNELTAASHCDLAATAESLAQVDDAAWDSLLTTLGDRVQYSGGAVPTR